MTRLEISTPVALGAVEAGQYVVIKNHPGEPALALPVVKSDPEKGSLFVIAGPASEGCKQMASLATGSVLQSVEGPYGRPLQANLPGTMLCVGDEIGAATLLALSGSLRKAGNRVVACLTASSAAHLVLEEQIGAVAHELFIFCRDSSPGKQRSLEQVIAQALRDHAFQGVFVMGGARTIRDTFNVSIHYPIPTQALLVAPNTVKTVHSIFRVNGCGNARSVRVEGHTFSAYYASFDEMVRRFEPVSETGMAVSPAR